jgi:hypothetical protein
MHAFKNSAMLPGVNDPCPEIALFVVGRALAQLYRATLEEPVPEEFAAILSRLDQMESSEGASRR